MRVVTSDGGLPRYAHECGLAVMEGFVPYGSPYQSGDDCVREFVKYEYDPMEEDEWDDDEEDEPQQPFETEDFFRDIDI